MQHEDVAAEVAEAVSEPRRVRAKAAPLPPLEVRAFGQVVTLAVTDDSYLRDDSYWRVRSIYQAALASQTVAATGVAIDVGAGYGCFTIPFAKAFPGWTVWSFEPEAEAYAALCENIKAHGLTNVQAINAAVGGPGDSDGVIAAALAGGNDTVLPLLPMAQYRRHFDLRGIVEALPVDPENFEGCDYPTLPSDALLALGPTLLKLTAPFAEAAVLEGLRRAPLDHVIGESWSHIAALAVYGDVAGLRQTWIPRAGDPLLRLRRQVNLNGHRSGLDVVVAMYNTRDWITDCVKGILDGAPADLRVLVVDDGSTDGSGDVVKAAFGDHPQVTLLQKANGGCASARNYGRMHSDASHIAFVDSDDVPGPGLFAGLLELARQTGAEVVQGGFDLLVQNEGGDWRVDPSYERSQPEVIHARRHAMGADSCHMMPTWLLIQGQPTIWRRAYRRDYLDNRNIWFPEHIRAFDDQIFQLMTLKHIYDVPMLDRVSYGYRQHPSQDIKQGDERCFYSLEMYRLILKRAVTEGWNDMLPVMQSYVNTVNWCWTILRPDLKPAFERGAAELWVYAQNTLDPAAFAGLGDTSFDAPDFGYFAGAVRAKMGHLVGSYGNVYLDSFDMHAAMVRSKNL